MRKATTQQLAFAAALTAPHREVNSLPLFVTTDQKDAQVRVRGTAEQATSELHLGPDDGSAQQQLQQPHDSLAFITEGKMTLEQVVDMYRR